MKKLYGSVVVALLAASPSYAVNVYTMSGNAEIVDTLDAAAFKDRMDSFSAKDPNFKDKPAAKYSGIPVEKLRLGKSTDGSQSITFICSDNYLYADTVKNMIDLGALIANKRDGVDVPKDFGGPLTMVHRKETTPDRYPWYIDSIVVGDIVKPTLQLSHGSDAATQIKWDDFAKMKSNTTKEMTMATPRGRHMDKPSTESVKAKFSFVSMTDLVKMAKASSYKLTLTQFSFKAAPRDITEKDFANLSVVWQKDGKEIPAYEGGPFIVFKNGAEKEMNATFHVTSIEIKAPNS